MTDLGTPVSQISGIALESVPATIFYPEGNLYAITGAATAITRVVKLDHDSFNIISEYNTPSGQYDTPANSFLIHEGNLYVGLNQGGYQLDIINLATMTRVGTIALPNLIGPMIKYGNIGYIGVQIIDRLYRINLTTNTIIDYLSLTITPNAMDITSTGSYIVISDTSITANIQRINTSTFLKDGETTYAGSTGNAVFVFIDKDNNYAYAGRHTYTIYKFALNGTFRKILPIAFDSSLEWTGLRTASDLYKRYLYVCGYGSLGLIHKYDLEAGLWLSAIDTELDTIVSGVTILNYSYWGSLQSPTKIVKINNADIRVVDQVTLPTGYNNTRSLFSYSG